ncbi:MAG: alpha/beta hydrolase [Planctomycetaceae bacterium]|nr:alpha/beta hydrolase [Planctomycetaceae bacterium]
MIDDTIAAQPTVPPRKPARLWWRVLLRLAILFVAIPYVAIGGLMVFMQRQLLFVPTKTSPLLAAEYSTAASPIEDVTIPAANGLVLHGWRFHSPSGQPQTGKRLVLYFPGNAGCRRDRISDCRDFTQLGCEVLLMDYRGYGDNEGSPSEVLLAADARRAWMYATQELGYHPSELIFFGESLGGAVAIRLAAEFSIVGDPPAALILNSTFASMGDTVAWHFPAYPFRYFLLDPFPSIKRIPRVDCPLLQFHGTVDETVPFAHGERLFERAAPVANAVPKRFVTIPGAGHNMISAADMSEAMRTLFDQLDAR